MTMHHNNIYFLRTFQYCYLYIIYLPNSKVSVNFRAGFTLLTGSSLYLQCININIKDNMITDIQFLIIFVATLINTVL